MRKIGLIILLSIIAIMVYALPPINSDILPNSSSSFDLGSSIYRWRYGFIDGGYFNFIDVVDSLSINNINIYANSIVDTVDSALVLKVNKLIVKDPADVNDSIVVNVDSTWMVLLKRGTSTGAYTSNEVNVWTGRFAVLASKYDSLIITAPDDTFKISPNNGSPDQIIIRQETEVTNNMWCEHGYYTGRQKWLDNPLPLYNWMFDLSTYSKITYGVDSIGTSIRIGAKYSYGSVVSANTWYFGNSKLFTSLPKDTIKHWFVDAPDSAIGIVYSMKYGDSGGEPVCSLWIETQHGQTIVDGIELPFTSVLDTFWIPDSLINTDVTLGSRETLIIYFFVHAASDNYVQLYEIIGYANYRRH